VLRRIHVLIESVTRQRPSSHKLARVTLR
jgi:hypothetical protein